VYLCLSVRLTLQACRGNELDDGRDVDDAIGELPSSAQRIPIEADFIYAYSTTPGLCFFLSCPVVIVISSSSLLPDVAGTSTWKLY